MIGSGLAARGSDLGSHLRGMGGPEEELIRGMGDAGEREETAMNFWLQIQFKIGKKHRGKLRFHANPECRLV